MPYSVQNVNMLYRPEKSLYFLMNNPDLSLHKLYRALLLVFAPKGIGASVISSQFHEF
jgi:hypothetical protein